MSVHPLAFRRKTYAVLTAAVTTGLTVIGTLALGGGSPAATAAPSTSRLPAASTGRVTPAVDWGARPRAVGTARGAGVAFSCQATTPVGCFGPAQMRAAYGFDQLISKGIDGRGTTIVIVDAFQAPTLRHDLALFDKAFNLPPAQLSIMAPDGLTKFDPNDADQVGWTGEISLDVQWAHAIAPKAKIDLVLAKSDEDSDFESVLSYVSNHGLGDVVSQSYSGPECDTSLVKSAHRSMNAMVAHGTTPVAATGDNGPAQFPCVGTKFVRSAGNPASDPVVTAVGGTALFAAGSSGRYQREQVWDEQQYEIAGGSGLSTAFTEPAFQAGVQHTGQRSVPDVAYSAAGDEGVLVVDSTLGGGPDLFYVFDGTSCGTPQWSALIALSVQVAGHRLGDINPALYRLGTSSAYRTLFHDVTTGSNTITLTNGNGSQPTFRGPAAHPGWDGATGLGSPRADALVPALAAAAAG